GLTRRNASGNGGEAVPGFDIPEGFEDVPVEDIGEGIKTTQRWARLSGEQKDTALDHGLECIANNSNLLKLGNDNNKWFQLVTSVARSGAPHRGDIFVKYAGAVPGADSAEELRKKLAYCEKNSGTITVGTFIKWAREYGADFEPWFETANLAEEQAPPGFKLKDDEIYRKNEIDEQIALGHTILVVGSKTDADRLWLIGVPTTCSARGKWTRGHSEQLRDADIVASDNATCQLLLGIAKRVRILKVPNGNISAWLDEGHTREQLDALIAQASDYELEGVTLNDFFAYMPLHNYIYAPARDHWPASSVNARIRPVMLGFDKNGKPKMLPAADWLDRNKPVEQMTWAPGEPMLIRDRLVSEGGWIERNGVSVFNLYRPPTLVRCT